MFNFGLLGTIPREEAKKLDPRLAEHDNTPWKAWAIVNPKPKEKLWNPHEPLWFVWNGDNFLNYGFGVNDDVILEVIAEECGNGC